VNNYIGDLGPAFCVRCIASNMVGRYASDKGFIPFLVYVLLHIQLVDIIGGHR
jgi:hypothetical protein